MIGWIILICVLGIILWLLLVPIRIVIDTEQHQYEFHWKSVLKVALIVTGVFPKICIQSWFWQKEIDLRDTSIRPKRNIKKLRSKSEKNKFLRLRKMWKMLHSFRIKKCKIELDTGDVITNAYLYPFFFQLGFWFKKPIRINFSGRNIVQVVGQNRLINLLIAYFV